MARDDVMKKYQLVFKHDRAGRLVEAQEFEHLAFARERFSDELLRLLTTHTAESVTVEGRSVAIKHVYAERKVTPLNLYLREFPEAKAREAVIDYGNAIRDLAATNIFPGDLLLKNFGVTRQGRVIFYDYDELCHVTECKFRRLPVAVHDEDEFSAEPWFYVADGDVFPEEWINFIGLHGAQRDAFMRSHAPLLTASWWNEMRDRHNSGEIPDIFPYRAEHRLNSRSPSAGDGGNADEDADTADRAG
jgi:isocitrate dehydrogenase kinase/phosphatase